MERTPSRSPSPRRSPSPHRVRSPPPHGRRSPSPQRRKRSPSPRRGRSPSPRVGRSPSPRRARSPSPPRRGRSPSPRGRVRSPSPRRARSPPRGRSPPPRNRSPSPRGRGRSPSPLRGRRSPPRDRSPPRHYASRSSQSDRAIFVGNMDPLCPIPEIERLFAPYGKVLRVDMKHGYAFIFLDRGHEEAIRGLDGFLYMGRRLKLEFAKGDGAIKRREEMRKEDALRRPCETLFVVNYDPIRTTQEDLSRLFSPYGHITRIEMRRNFAFVQFERVEQATEALKTLNQTKLMDRIINIEYVARAPPPPERKRARSPPRSPPRHRSPSPPISRRRLRSRSPSPRGGRRPFQDAAPPPPREERRYSDAYELRDRERNRDRYPERDRGRDVYRR